MAQKVTIHKETPKPSDTVVKSPSATVEGVDEKGRVIRMRKPGVLAGWDLPRILGPQDAVNPVCYNQAQMLLHVAELDGEPVFFTTAKELRALVQRLDHEGIATVTELYLEHFVQLSSDEEEEEKEEIKK